MAEPSTAPINKKRKIKNRVVISVWLIMALSMAALALVLWPISKAAASKSGDEANDEAKPAASSLSIRSSSAEITRIGELHELDDAVHPVSFDALVKDLRDYPAEFKDAQYLKKNKGKWTVQVMDVSEHDIITAYLDSRDDREKFAYFRYRNDDNQPRYILTYGAMKTPQLAMGAAKTVKFDLPANVRVLPEEINRYIDIIENYELSEPMQDLSANPARKVRLKPTKREIAAKRRPVNHDSKSQSNRTSTSETDANDNSLTNQDSTNSNDEVSATNSTNDSMPLERNIEGSNDTSETISVKEQRNLVDKDAAPQEEGASRNTNGSKSDTNGTNKTTSNTDKASSTNNNQASKTDQKTDQKANQNIVKPSSTSNGQTETDRMKQLIEEKTP